MIITVAQLKGGTGKTTTSIGLTQALFEKENKQNKNITLIDTDLQSTAYKWATSVSEFSFLSVSKPSADVDKQIKLFPSKHIVIDTPSGHNTNDKAIVYSALFSSDVVIIATAPTGNDFEQVPQILQMIKETKAVNEHLKPYILLNQVVKNTKSLLSAVKVLSKNENIKLLDTQIPFLQAFAQANSKAFSNNELNYYKKIITQVEKDK